MGSLAAPFRIRTGNPRALGEALFFIGQISTWYKDPEGVVITR